VAGRRPKGTRRLLRLLISLAIAVKALIRGDEWLSGGEQGYSSEGFEVVNGDPCVEEVGS